MNTCIGSNNEGLGRIICKHGLANSERSVVLCVTFDLVVEETRFRTNTVIKSCGYPQANRPHCYEQEIDRKRYWASKIRVIQYVSSDLHLVLSAYH